MKNPKLIINHLTDNEDIRQELWVRYLEGTPLHALPCIFKNIQQTHLIEESLEQIFQELTEGPHWTILCKHFTDLELSIILLLTAGHDIIEISRYKGIAEVRIRQILSVIRSNKVWEEKWRLNDALPKMRNSA